MLRTRSVLLGMVAAMALSSASTADAGLFGRLFKKRCCKPAAKCCQPAPACATPAPACAPAAAPCGSCAMGPCLQDPELPGCSPAPLCNAQLQKDLLCCQSRHSGDPELMKLCERAAFSRFQKCRYGTGSGGGSATCDCEDPDDYGCSEQYPDISSPEYMRCFYQCEIDCQQ